MLGGLILRGVEVGGRAAELLGRGDLLHPWPALEGDPTVTPAVDWQVAEPARLALIDERVLTSLAGHPTLVRDLLEQLWSRTQRLATLSALGRTVGIERRLVLLLWHLADRWGVVRPEGVLLRLDLTHRALASLVAAQRPTVSGGLKELERMGVIARRPDGWLLRLRPDELPGAAAGKAGLDRELSRGAL